MTTPHDLFGIMKFMGREQWQSDLQEVMDEHFEAVLEETDLEFDDLGDILGEHWQMTLWGCAFEDALSLEFDDGRNPVDDYLKRRGFKETAYTKAYLQALRISIMSLYEVSEIVPGQSFLARDLLRGGDPVMVQEMSATKSLRPWEKIAARIVEVRGKTLLAGGVLPLSPQAAELLVEGMAKAIGKKPTRTKPLRLDDNGLRPLAPLFTMTWLVDTLPKASGTGLPDLRNRDGDPIMFHDIRFPLAEGTTTNDIASRLGGIADLEPASECFWNWLAKHEDAPRETKNVERRKCGSDDEAAALDVIMESGVPVLGNVELKERSLHLMVNSAERAARGMALLTDSLGGLVRSPLTSIQTVEQIMADRADRPDRTGSDEGEVPPEIATPLVHDMLTRQYSAILDDPVPMIGNKSPRAAAKNKAGRGKVAEWLKYLEYQSRGTKDPTDPMATYDFGWMWRELKVEDLRR